MELRQIALDTETTGLEPTKGHRIIEIGCIEMINRRLTGNNFHIYLDPERDIDAGAIAVHGITNASLMGKPKFADIFLEFKNYIDGAQLIIHNSAFDIGFLNHEIKLLDKKLQTVDRFCSVIDTLLLARKMHPGQKNSLDALCKRYHVDNTQRQLHGALLDAQLLARVYLSMTGGQTSLFAASTDMRASTTNATLEDNITNQLLENDKTFHVVRATEEELAQHQQRIKKLALKNPSITALWEHDL
jgi:DNA polymerase-3 subunit epsilon